MARFRSRSKLHTVGFAEQRTNGVVTSFRDNANPLYSVVTSRDDCTDELGRSVDHPLNIVHTNLLMSPLNGLFVNSLYRREYKTFMPQLAAFSHVSVPGAPSDTAAATTLLARTNPGRANVSLPVFIGELRDLPHMVKSAGDFILKRRRYWIRDSAGQYLSWQFGWAPLFSDLRKMIQFQDLVERRSQELKRLYSSGGLKRRFKIFTGNATAETNVTIESAFSTLVTTKRVSHTGVEKWGTVRWKPTSLPPVIDQVTLRRLARKAVFGMSIQAVDAWNLIPWTWLVDWFTNAGDFLEAHANRIPAAASGINIMTRTSTNISWRRTNQNWIEGGNGDALYESLVRTQPSAALSASLPFLSGRQLSILGALAVTRARTGHRL